MIKDRNKQTHVTWECKYHVIIMPKYRKKVLYGTVRKRVGEMLRTLAQQKGVEIIEGHLCSDHIHIAMSIPPKYSVAMIIGFLKGKSAIMLNREYSKGKKNYYGKHFWARGYFVSTIGKDEEEVKKYIRNQMKIEKSIDDNKLDLKW